MKIKTILKRTGFVIAALLLSFFFLIESALSINKASAETTTGINSITAESDVLDDLGAFQSDDPVSTDLSYYPADADRYDFKLVMLAEGAGGELFVYIYQPCYEVKNWVTKHISMATTVVDEDLNDLLYDLELLNSSGTLFKYRVGNFLVLDNDFRVYNISSIYRTYDSEIDGELNDSQTINAKAQRVGRIYEVKTVDGKVMYKTTNIDIVEYTSVWSGHISYSNGYFGNVLFEKTDAFFFVLDPLRKIEDLRAATITYNWSFKQFSHYFYTGDPDGETQDLKTGTETIKIKGTDTGSNEADGWFGHKWVWDRIVSVSDFLEQNSTILDEEIKTYLGDPLFADCWVLRFAEYLYSESTTENYRIKNYTEVSDITVLRLEYVTDGIVYNLGAAGDSTTPDKLPDGETTVGDGIQENFDDFMDEVKQMFKDLENALKSIFDGIGGVIITIVCVVAGLALLSFIPGVGAIFGLVFNVILNAIGLVIKAICWAIKLVFKVALWIIAFPFNLIGKLFKRNKKNE